MLESVSGALQSGEYTTAKTLLKQYSNGQTVLDYNDTVSATSEPDELSARLAAAAERGSLLTASTALGQQVLDRAAVLDQIEQIVDPADLTPDTKQRFMDQIEQLAFAVEQESAANAALDSAEPGLNDSPEAGTTQSKAAGGEPTDESTPGGRSEGEPTGTAPAAGVADVVEDADYQSYVDTGKLPPGSEVAVVSQIADAIQQGKSLTPPQLAIMQGYGEQVESELRRRVPKKRTGKPGEPKPLNRQPQDLREAILQYFASGGRMRRSDLVRYGDANLMRTPKGGNPYLAYTAGDDKVPSLDTLAHAIVGEELGQAMDGLDEQSIMQQIVDTVQSFSQNGGPRQQLIQYQQAQVEADAGRIDEEVRRGTAQTPLQVIEPFMAAMDQAGVSVGIQDQIVNIVARNYVTADGLDWVGVIHLLRANGLFERYDDLRNSLLPMLDGVARLIPTTNAELRAKSTEWLSETRANDMSAEWWQQMGERQALTDDQYNQLTDLFYGEPTTKPTGTRSGASGGDVSAGIDSLRTAGESPGLFGQGDQPSGGSRSDTTPDRLEPGRVAPLTTEQQALVDTVNARFDSDVAALEAEKARLENQADKLRKQLRERTKTGELFSQEPKKSTAWKSTLADLRTAAKKAVDAYTNGIAFIPDTSTRFRVENGQIVDAGYMQGSNYVSSGIPIEQYLKNNPGEVRTFAKIRQNNIDYFAQLSESWPDEFVSKADSSTKQDVVGLIKSAPPTQRRILEGLQNMIKPSATNQQLDLTQNEQTGLDAEDAVKSKLGELQGQLAAIEDKINNTNQSRQKAAEVALSAPVQTALFQAGTEQVVPLDPQLHQALVNRLLDTFMGILDDVQVVAGEQITAQSEAVTGQQLRQEGGTVYGLVIGNTLLLNGDALNANTPIHEFGHIWGRWVKTARPDLYEAGLSKAKASPYFEGVSADPFYISEADRQNLTGNERDDFFADEALARAIGDEGAKFVTQATIKGFRGWLGKLWSAIKDRMGIESKSSEEIQQMDLQTFAQGVAARLLQGSQLKPPVRVGSTAIQTMFIGEKGASSRRQLVSQLEDARLLYSQQGLEEKTFAQIQADPKLKQPWNVIRAKTGWHIAPDNKWVYEIRDNEIQFVVDPVSALEGVRQAGQPVGGKLSNLINHPTLFALYPELADYEITFSDIPSNQQGESESGGYSPNSNFIEINLNALSDGTGQNQTDQLRRTLTHELQHAVQQIEGHAGGTSPQRTLSWILAGRSPQAQQYQAAYSNLQRQVNESTQKAGIPEKQADQANPDSEVGQAVRRVRQFLFDTYQKNAGEISARTSADRMLFNEYERQYIDPYQLSQTFDRIDPGDIWIQDEQGSRQLLVEKSPVRFFYGHSSTPLDQLNYNAPPATSAQPTRPLLNVEAQTLSTLTDQYAARSEFRRQLLGLSVPDITATLKRQWEPVISQLLSLSPDSKAAKSLQKIRPTGVLLTNQGELHEPTLLALAAELKAGRSKGSEATGRLRDLLWQGGTAGRPDLLTAYSGALQESPNLIIDEHGQYRSADMTAEGLDLSQALEKIDPRNLSGPAKYLGKLLTSKFGSNVFLPETVGHILSGDAGSALRHITKTIRRAYVERAAEVSLVRQRQLSELTKALKGLSLFDGKASASSVKTLSVEGWLDGKKSSITLPVAAYLDLYRTIKTQLASAGKSSALADLSGAGSLIPQRVGLNANNQAVTGEYGWVYIDPTNEQAVPKTILISESTFAGLERTLQTEYADALTAVENFFTYPVAGEYLSDIHTILSGEAFVFEADYYPTAKYEPAGKRSSVGKGSSLLTEARILQTRKTPPLRVVGSDVLGRLEGYTRQENNFIESAVTIENIRRWRSRHAETLAKTPWTREWVVPYLDALESDLNNPQGRADNTDQFSEFKIAGVDVGLKAWIKRLTRSNFGGSLTMPLKQLSTYLNLFHAGVIDNRYILQAGKELLRLGIDAYRPARQMAGDDLFGNRLLEVAYLKEIAANPYAATLLSRVLGRSDAYLGAPSVDDFSVNAKDAAVQAVRKGVHEIADVALRGMRAADRANIIVTYLAAKYQVQAEIEEGRLTYGIHSVALDSDKALRRISELATEAVYVTNQMSALSDQTPLARSRSFFSMLVGLYSGQTQRLLNSVLTSAADYIHAPDGAAKQVALQQLLWRGGNMILLNAVLMGFINALWRGFTNVLTGDEDEAPLESFAWDVSRNLLTTFPSVPTEALAVLTTRFDSAPWSDEFLSYPAADSFERLVVGLEAGYNYLGEDDPQKQAKQLNSMSRNILTSTTRLMGVPSALPKLMLKAAQGKVEPQATESTEFVTPMPNL